MTNWSPPHVNSWDWQPAGPGWQVPPTLTPPASPQPGGVWVMPGAGRWQAHFQRGQMAHACSIPQEANGMWAHHSQHGDASAQFGSCPNSMLDPARQAFFMEEYPHLCWPPLGTMHSCSGFSEQMGAAMPAYGYQAQPSMSHEWQPWDPSQGCPASPCRAAASTRLRFDAGEAEVWAGAPTSAPLPVDFSQQTTVEGSHASTFANYRGQDDQVKQPAPGLARLLCEQKRRLKPSTVHVDGRASVASALVRGSAINQCRGHAASAGISRSLSANWVLDDFRTEHDQKGTHSNEAKPDLAAVREVLLQLEAAVPVGCDVTVHINGQPSLLRRPTIRRKGNLAIGEQRFAVVPVGQRGTSEHQAADDAECLGGHREEALSEPQGSGGAAFVATVQLETCQVQVRTLQELTEPNIDIIEVLDTAVVLRMGQLTGDRFELTVYPSGSESMGIAQHGPVRSPESVHRIGQLESSKVYVAWVRVFCEGEVKESAPKGFKTREARVRTIWDDQDHVILGVLETASAQEITKAWRTKSLQFHPDKETDPEKKDWAEDMMKRLNLAKQNMLRHATRDGMSTPCTPSTPQSTGTCFGRGGSSTDCQQNSEGSCHEERFEEPPAGHSGLDPPACAGAPSREAFRSEEKERCGGRGGPSRVCCGLRIVVPRLPRLRVVERLLRALRVEVVDLPLSHTFEVQILVNGEWAAAAPPATATEQSMQLTVNNLQEDSSYYLRVRIYMELEPLRLAFAEFAASEGFKADDASMNLRHSTRIDSCAGDSDATNAQDYTGGDARTDH